MTKNRLQKILMLLFLIPVMLFAAPPAGTVLTLEENASDSSISLTYDATNQENAEAQVAVQRILDGGTPRNGRDFDPLYTYITASAGASSNITQRQLVHSNGLTVLNYNIYKDSGHQDIVQNFTGEINKNNVLFHLFPATHADRFEQVVQLKTHTYYIKIPADQFVPAGTYTDNIALDLYSSPAESTSPDSAGSQIPVELSVYAQPHLDITITDNSVYSPDAEPYTMEFGNLSGNPAPQSTNAIARANVVHSISVSSQYGGRLKHQYTQDFIPYTMSVNGGGPIALAGSSNLPVEIVSSAMPTSSLGELYDIEITVSDVSTAPEGDYSDNVTFEISAN
ncbi:MAG: spore coat protein U domain-containing protein [Spirochaetota bacterium]